MRNLKRVLSLALSLVMVLGLLVITSSAATTTSFKDADEITNVEAVDVLSALKVLEGDDNGNFNPTQILTRETAAKIICYMLIGPDNADRLGGSAAFTDVAADRWSAGYIAYCANLGILAGAGDGTFNPEGELTGVAFAKMLLVALGYDADIQGYVGENWAIAIATDAVAAGIDASLNLSAPLAREDAAQMAFQTLTANTVSYASKGTNVTTSDGTTIVVGASPAAFVSVGAGAANYCTVTGDSANDDGYQQFCEKYFPTLKQVDGVADGFNRPAAYNWELKGTTVSSVSATPVVTFTTKTSAANVAKALTGYYLTDTSADKHSVNNITSVSYTGASGVVYDNGSAGSALSPSSATTAATLAALTANGKVVEVYADSDNVITKVVTVTYKVGKVTSIVTTAEKTTYNITNGVSGVDYVDETLTDTVKVDGTIAKGDIVTYVTADSVTYVYPTTPITGTQTAKTSGTDNVKLTIDGATYTLGTGVYDSAAGTTNVAAASFVNSAVAAIYYVDLNGFVVETTSTAASTDYALIVGATGSLATTVDGSTPSVQARVVLADGTVAIKNVAVYKLTAADVASSGNYYSTTASNTSNLNSGITLAEGDYVVKGTTLCIYDADYGTSGASNTSTTVNTVVSDAVPGGAGLVGGTFGYTLDGDTITLESLTALPANSSDATANTVYAGTTTGNITKGTISYTANTDKTILADSNTKFVVYNSASKSATVYTGPSALPTNISNASVTGDAVLTASGTKVGTASVIFVQIGTSLTADSTGAYVYIDSSKYTQSLSGTTTTYTYTGTTASGDDTVTVTSTSMLAASGLYTYGTDGVVDTTALATTSTTTPATTATYIYDATLTVTGSLLCVTMTGSTETYYNITDDTQIVYINSALSEVNGNGGFVVRATSGGVATNDIAAIFVTVD